MYRSHFGLTLSPFTLTADPDFFFPARAAREALNTLLYAAGTGEGFVLITGEVSIGKTMLCRKLMEEARGQFCIAHLPVPATHPQALLCDLATELGVKWKKGADETAIQGLLTARLIQIAEKGQRTLLCLDEAQALPTDTLEALRLLTNLETRHNKLLQVAVFGQPELEAKLADPAIRQLKQRITSHYRLRPFSRAEVADYLDHRLRAAGYRGARVFRGPAIGLMHLASGGMPRLLNIMANKALLLAFAAGRHEVTLAHVLAAAQDTPGVGLPQWLAWRKLA